MSYVHCLSCGTTDHLVYVVLCNNLFSELFLTVTSIEKRVKQSLYRSRQTLGVPGGWGSQIARQMGHEGGKIVLFHAEWMQPTHQTGIRRHDSHDAVVTGHEEQAFDSCWQMVLGTLCDVLPPDVTGTTMQDPCVVWSVHTKMMRLPEIYVCEARMKLRPQDMAVDKKTSLLPGLEKRLPVISLN
jgi:hypothetical protein